MQPQWRVCWLPALPTAAFVAIYTGGYGSLRLYANQCLPPKCLCVPCAAEHTHLLLCASMYGAKGQSSVG